MRPPAMAASAPAAFGRLDDNPISGAGSATTVAGSGSRGASLGGTKALGLGFVTAGMANSAASGIREALVSTVGGGAICGGGDVAGAATGGLKGLGGRSLDRDHVGRRHFCFEACRSLGPPNELLARRRSRRVHDHALDRAMLPTLRLGSFSNSGFGCHIRQRTAQWQPKDFSLLGQHPYFIPQQGIGVSCWMPFWGRQLEQREHHAGMNRQRGQKMSRPWNERVSAPINFIARGYAQPKLRESCHYLSADPGRGRAANAADRRTGNYPLTV